MSHLIGTQCTLGFWRPLPLSPGLGIQVLVFGCRRHYLLNYLYSFINTTKIKRMIHDVTSLQGLLFLQQVELVDDVVDLFLQLLDGRVFS